MHNENKFSSLEKTFVNETVPIPKEIEIFRHSGIPEQFATQPIEVYGRDGYFRRYEIHVWEPGNTEKYDPDDIEEFQDEVKTIQRLVSIAEERGGVIIEPATVLSR